jgi:uncharacterized membrane protein
MAIITTALVTSGIATGKAAGVHWPGGRGVRALPRPPKPLDTANSGGITMSDVPVQIVVAAFNDPGGADQALKALQEAKSAGLVTIDDAAVLTKDADGKLHIKEPSDWGGGRGAMIGGVTGAAVGLLAGPIGWAAGIGALIGGLASKLRDSGFPDDRLRQLGESLKPNTSAIVAVVEHRWVETLEKQLVEAGADTLTQEVGADIAQQLEAGRDVAYTALSAAGVVTAGRVAAGEGSVEASSVTATPEGVTVEGVSIQAEPGKPGDAGQPATGATSASEGTTPSGSGTPPAPTGQGSAQGGSTPSSS